MLEVHGGAEAIDFCAEKGTIEDALEQALVVVASRVAGRGGAPVTCWDEFEGLRLGSTHAAGHDAQALGAVLDFDHGADKVAFFAPELEQAAAMRLGDGVVRETHVKEDAAVFE